MKVSVLGAVYKQTGRRFVPAAVSNRHVHLSRRDLDTLFGTDYELVPMKALVQPGQFASSDTVSLAGPKGRIDGIRVLGPVRGNTQVEISLTDSFTVGIEPVIRMSGDLEGSPGARLITKRGSIELKYGVLIAARHLHVSVEQAKMLDLKNGQSVSLKKAGEREITFGNFIVRSGPAHELEAHIDRDEANAAMICDGEYLEIIA
ncbi:phosphate propanoyltransferase [Clostridia bacterium]|nr:phosphate propanoyltransferase [Clostridia bacterium]